MPREAGAQFDSEITGAVLPLAFAQTNEHFPYPRKSWPHQVVHARSQMSRCRNKLFGILRFHDVRASPSLEPRKRLVLKFPRLFASRERNTMCLPDRVLIACLRSKGSGGQVLLFTVPMLFLWFWSLSSDEEAHRSVHECGKQRLQVLQRISTLRGSH